MPVTIMLNNVLPGQMRVLVSPLAELCACLHALTESEHHPGSTAWARATLDDAPADFRLRLRQFAPLWSAYRCRIFFPYGTIPPPSDIDLDTQLSMLAATDIGQLSTMITWSCVGGYSRWPSQSTLPDSEHTTNPTALAAALSTLRVELLERLTHDPASLRTDLVDFLRQAAEVAFTDYWQVTKGPLLAEARRMRAMLSRHGIKAAFGSLPGARLLDNPDRVTVGKFSHQIIRASRRGMNLIPSRYGFPHFLVKAEPREVPTIQYPIAQSLVKPADETMRKVQALAQPSRWPLCRLIAREALPPTEIARRTRMTLPQVSRHLRALRGLDLVTVAHDGRHRYYRLNMVVISHLGADLIQALFV